MFVMHPHIRLIMVVFMFPTAWNSFSNAMLTGNNERKGERNDRIADAKFNDRFG